MDDLPVVEFADAAALHEWLVANHASSPGVWVRPSRSRSRRPSVTFDALLDEGLCFGWSESTRRAFDRESYLQRFTPRRVPGTASDRNRRRVAVLRAQDRVTPAGLAALGLD